MSAQILFTDLDGTLLNDEKAVTPGNRRAIDEALAAGKKIVAASGRSLNSTLRQAERVGLTEPGCFVIAYNGGVIYDCSRRELISRRPLDMASLVQLFDEARRRGIYIQTYDQERVVAEPWCDPAVSQWYSERTSANYHTIHTVREDLSEPPVKALMIDLAESGVLDEMKAWTDTALAGRVDSFHSSAFFLEVVATGVSKGAAVAELCRLLDIPIAESVAAGDEANDVSMLRAAGVGAAMANGVQAVKDAADYVTERDNNHDGIAEIIRKFLL
ncbi:MAG: Cof-type HAD-IIB family hydrolase [Oscillospiraceae bacterium]|nr:Cof-type HAD-IIB family hydrolase [Oscillospiraceae bacterium]